MNFPADTNELRREMATVAERLAALKRELLRRHKEQQKWQTAVLKAELDTLFQEPREERRKGARRVGVANRRGDPYGRAGAGMRRIRAYRKDRRQGDRRKS